MKTLQMLAFICLSSITVHAQGYLYKNSDSVLIATGMLKASNGLIIGSRDTLNHPWRDSMGLVTMRPSDSCLYMSDGIKWIKILSAADLSNFSKNYLDKNNNFADLGDPAGARRNLQLGSVALLDSITASDIKGLSAFVVSSDLEGITSKNYRTSNPLETSGFLRVRGKNQSTFIDINHTPLTSWNEPVNIEDTNIVYTITPVNWAENKPVPSLRMRHPLNTFESVITNNRFLNTDFKILPYQYGWAIEYNGIVECWVGEWSIHRGNAYQDVEGRGNGWGAVSWVGDDLDEGGLRMTARNNPEAGINYGELSVEKFGGLPNGNMHFRLPDVANVYKWTWGARGDSNTAMALSPDKLEVYKRIETGILKANNLKADSVQLGNEGQPGLHLYSIIENLPVSSTLNHIGWLNYNIAGYKNFAGSTGYFTRSDIATDHVFFTGAEKPVPSMILTGNGNLSLGSRDDSFKLNVYSDKAVTAKFSGRVIGANAVDSNEFVTLNQLVDSLKAIKKELKGRSAKMKDEKIDQSTIVISEADGLTSDRDKISQVIYNSFHTDSDGKSTAIRIAHGLVAKPEWWNVQASSLEATNILFVSADDKYLIIHYQNPPKAGVENLSYNISYKTSYKAKYL